MNITIELPICSEDAKNVGLEDGDSTSIFGGCYMSKDANFYHVELGSNNVTGEPIIRVTGHNRDDEEVTKYVLVNPLDDDFRTLAGLIYNSEYLGEV